MCCSYNLVPKRRDHHWNFIIRAFVAKSYSLKPDSSPETFGRTDGAKRNKLETLNLKLETNERKCNNFNPIPSSELLIYYFSRNFKLITNFSLNLDH